MRRFWYIAAAMGLVAACGARAQTPSPKAWTFTLKAPLTGDLSYLDRCGLVAPKGWREGAVFRRFHEKGDLPASLDLRPWCPPVRNQGDCGSCWAFATVGAFECAMGVREGIAVDLSEQWLVSCNQETSPPHVLGEGSWSCEGGWFAHDYHLWKADSCGGYGAVLESQFLYQAEDLPCNCPYTHSFFLDSWAYVGGEDGVPADDEIKRAMMAYGPVAAAVYANEAFAMYSRGVLNASELEEVNHAVVLVGWDDSLGAEGAWILRNSWGGTWGYHGYMYIEYGCSNVGFGASYIDYTPSAQVGGPSIEVQPHSGIAEVAGSYRFSVRASGLGELHYQWRKDGVAVGSDSALLLLETVSEADEGVYWCEVSDLRGVTPSIQVGLVVAPEGSMPVSRGMLLWSLIVLLAVSGARAVWCGRELGTLGRPEKE